MTLKPLKTFILLHGAWHASWCWRYITPLLQSEGHTVIAPDLPGHGDDPTPLAQITLKTYVDFVGNIISAQPKRVVLVGHSMAGVIISQLAENMPEKIAQLIYLAAFIPANGESLLEQARKSQAPGVGPEMLFDRDNYSIGLKPSERLIELFYGNCPMAEVNFALQNLREEPSRPFVDALTYSDERFGRVKKRYIACLQDQMITLADQQRIYTALTSDVIQLDTDHSPFFSAPKALVLALLG